jgi:hypothetical protein
LKEEEEKIKESKRKKKEIQKFLKFKEEFKVNFFLFY